MAVNPYFKNYGLNGDNTNEQNLVKDLVQESIQMFGIDVFYLPRKDDGVDTFLGENILSYFDEKFEIEMYPTNIDSFGGPETDFMGSGGMWEVKDQITFEISTKSWEDIVSSYYLAPREGDLIYYPLTKTLFIITFVEDEDQFYPRGTLPKWKINCEIFDYNHEEMDTGIEAVDNLDDIDLSDETIFDERYPDAQTVNDETDAITDDSDNSDIWGKF